MRGFRLRSGFRVLVLVNGLTIVISASASVRTKFARESAKDMIGKILRAHADAAVGAMLSLYPWGGLADVVRAISGV